MRYFPIAPTPWTRVNDYWIDTSDINGGMPLVTYTDPLIEGNANDTRFFTPHYNNMAVDIVAETVFNYPYPCVTEKTIRPILHRKIFIMLSPHGVLKMLHEKGFETFDGFIDETYDSIKDPTARFHAVVEETIRLCNKPLSEVLSYMDTIEDKLNHNFELLKKLEDIELAQL